MNRERTRRRVAIALTALVMAWPHGLDRLSAQDILPCTIDSSGLEFGLYDPLDPSPLDGTGGITYTCSTHVAVTILITAGTSGSFDRTMSGGSDKLAYNLYQDAAHTKVWGDGALGTSVYVDLNPPQNAAVGVPVYGRIPARQSVAEGRYTDSLEIVMIF